MNHKVLLCMGAALLVSGCASHTLTRDDNLGHNNLGSYTMPKASVTFSVYYARTQNGAGLIVAAEKPRIVTGEILPLTAHFNGASEDKFTVDIDPLTGFLKKVSLNMDDRSSEIAEAAAGSLGAIAAFNPLILTSTPQAGAESADYKHRSLSYIGSAVADPTDAKSLTEANFSLWSQTLSYIEWRGKDDCLVEKAAAAEASKQKPKENGKANAASNAVSVDLSRFSLCSADTKAALLLGRAEVRWADIRAADIATSMPMIQVTPSAKQSDDANLPCHDKAVKAIKVGLCVRGVSDVQIALGLPSGAKMWRSARLPATGKEYILNVNRIALADRAAEFEFTDGVQGKVEISQDSYVENAFLLPKIFIDSAIDSLGKTTEAISKIIPVRVEYRALRRPDEAKTAGSESGTDGDAGSETAAGESEAPAPKPAATTPNVAVSVPGTNGASATTVTVTSSAESKGQEKAGPSEETVESPTLWFAACTYGVLCQGPLQSALNGDAYGAVDAAGRTIPPAGTLGAQPQAPSAQQPPTAQPPTQAPGVTSPGICTDLNKPECKPGTGKTS